MAELDWDKLNMAAGLLAGGAPSTDPRSSSLGWGLSLGINNMQRNRSNTEENKRAELYLQLMQQANARKQFDLEQRLTAQRKGDGGSVLADPAGFAPLAAGGGAPSGAMDMNSLLQFLMSQPGSQ